MNSYGQIVKAVPGVKNFGLHLLRRRTNNRLLIGSSTETVHFDSLFCPKKDNTKRDVYWPLFKTWGFNSTEKHEVIKGSKTKSEGFYFTIPML